MRPGPGGRFALGPGIASGVMVGHGVGLMVRYVVARAGAGMVARRVMMALRGERRAGKHHQHQGGGKNLFHGKNVAQEHRRRKRNERPEPREEREAAGARRQANQRKLKEQ